MEIWICCDDRDGQIKKVVDSEEKAKEFVTENDRYHWFYGPYVVMRAVVILAAIYGLVF